MASEDRDQRLDALPALAPIHRIFDQAHAFRRQHGPGQLAELVPQLRFGERIVEIATMAVAALRRLASIRQHDRDARLPQARRDGAHRRVFGHRTRRRSAAITGSVRAESSNALNPACPRTAITAAACGSEYFDAK